MRQDKDPTHTAKRAMKLIRRYKWSVLNWPSQCPNFSSPAEGESEKTAERSLIASLENDHIRRKQEFGDVRGLQVRFHCMQTKGLQLNAES